MFLQIQLSSQGSTPIRGENIQYIYTNSKHKNPLCRVIPVLKHEKEEVVRSYDKEKYLELLLNAAETVLGYFGFDGSVYMKPENKERNNKKKKWWDELREERKKVLKLEETPEGFSFYRHDFTVATVSTQATNEPRLGSTRTINKIGTF